VISVAAVGDQGQSTAAPERSLGLAGSIIKARYRVLAVSSVSRDVVVYTAEELRYGRPIALEVLRDEVAGDAEFVAAVRDLACTLAMSAHVYRGLPRVYECGATDTGQLFIALERTEGATLRKVLDARGALDPSTALRIASQVGEALESLHHNRIIHGQLGPDSVLVATDNDGMEHVTLVGVELTAAQRTAIGLRLRDASPPAYLAPEQVEGGETTDATDQYALGMLLRELLTGDGSRETTGARTATPALPPAIERIITTALDARPEHRYPDISVMVNDMWGAQTVLAELEPRPRLESRPRSVKLPANARRRRPRPRRPHFTLRIAAAVAIGGVIAVIVWVALSDRMVSRFRARVTAPPVTAVPVDRGTTPLFHPLPTDPPHVPSSASPAREETSTLPEPHAVKDASSVEVLAHPAAAPRPAPLVERQEPVAAPVVGDSPRRPVESRAPAERPAKMDEPARDARDGSAIIDWVLKSRR
jgi:serine/threonine protein kinase